MTELEYLQSVVGGKWTGMRFLSHSLGAKRKTNTLCEALSLSFMQNLTVVCNEFDCSGALRCLGHCVNDEQLATHITEEAGIELHRIRQIIAGSPRMNPPMTAIELGKIGDPEICIGYLRPESAMRLLRQWQQLSGMRFNTVLSTFMAVCSAVVTSYIDHKLVFSLGCPESRQRGGIPPDRLVAALPCSLVTNMMQEVSKCQHMNTSVQNAVITLNNSRT